MRKLTIDIFVNNQKYILYLKVLNNNGIILLSSLNIPISNFCFILRNLDCVVIKLNIQNKFNLIFRAIVCILSFYNIT